MLGTVLLIWAHTQLVGSVKSALATAPPPPVKPCANGTSHQRLSRIAQGTAFRNHSSRRPVSRRPIARSTSSGVPARVQTYATTSMGGLNPRKAVGMRANPATAGGIRLPCATRTAMPVMSAMHPTEMMLSGLGNRVRKKPLSTPKRPAHTMASSERTKAPATYAVPKATSP